MGEEFLNHSNIEAVLNNRQPGDSPRKTKQRESFKEQSTADPRSLKTRNKFRQIRPRDFVTWITNHSRREVTRHSNNQKRRKKPGTDKIEGGCYNTVVISWLYYRYIMVISWLYLRPVMHFIKMIRASSLSRWMIKFFVSSSRSTAA